MKTAFKVIKNTYRDSVSLMQIATKLNALEGVASSSMNMATPANCQLLQETGYDLAGIDAGPNDLLIAVNASDETIIGDAFALAEAQLSAKNELGDAQQTLPIKTLEQAYASQPAGLALISVAGDYALAEAYKALNLGMHVMLFSDNIAVADEKAIKEHAKQLGKIVMGPDCGTAIIDGIPLAFANVVRRGDIGLIAASGTGLQEVTVLIDRLGGGITQAIGTGGHDLSENIGGLSMLAGLDMLEKDTQTQVITLISKPPAPSVAKTILTRLGEICTTSNKKAVVCFLGADANDLAADLARYGSTIRIANTLAEAADLSVQVSGRVSGHADGKVDNKTGSNTASKGEEKTEEQTEGNTLPRTAAEMSEQFTHQQTLSAIKSMLKPSQKYLRGLFSGGTFAYEATILLQQQFAEVFSNTRFGRAQALPDLWQSSGHTIIDLGDDVFTRGRPHPMIDLTFRHERILQEAADDGVAVIVLDLVLGYGAHVSPADDLAPIINEAKAIAQQAGRELPFIVHICGTEGDPQNLARQTQLLAATGALLADSNVAAIEQALALVSA